MADRKSLQTYVTPEAHKGWHEWCASQGISFSALLGHSDMTTTMNTYGHLVESVQRENAEKIDHFFESRTAPASP